MSSSPDNETGSPVIGEQPRPPVRARGRVALWWPAALIPVLAFIAFAPGVRNGFVHWDDVPYIVDNPHMTRADGLSRIWFTRESLQYYPLTFTSYWLEYQLWGPWPTGYFLSNLALHALNSLLVYFVARALGLGRAAAWIVGALFAVHPVQVASVAWLAQRKNVLCGVFFLASFLLYWRYCRRGGLVFYVASLVACAGALLSKTAAVTLPVSLVLAEWLLLKRRDWEPVRRMAPMLALALVLGLVTISQERVISPGVVGAAPEPLAAAAAIWFYLGKILWPATLLALYPPWHVSAASVLWWLPVGGLTAAIAAVWYGRRRLGDLPVWGLSHFIVTLLPNLGLIPFGYVLTSPVGDHFLYLALPGFFIAVVALGQTLVTPAPGASAAGLAPSTPASSTADTAVAQAASVPRCAALGVALAVVLLPLGVKTWKQVQIWHDGVRLWSYTLARNPDNVLAHNNLGVALAAEGRLEEALGSYRAAVRLAPTFWMARLGVGIALRDLGRLDEAVAEFRGIVKDAPENPVAHFNLANVLVQHGQQTEAFAEYAEAVRLDPLYAEARTNWGVALANAGALEEAVAQLETALQLNPDDATAHYNLGLIWAGQGRLDRAAEQYLAALQLKPKSPQIYTNLGLVRASQGKTLEATRYLRAALELNPDDALAHLNLGTLAAQLGRTQEAETHFRAALRIDPADVEANNNLGRLLALRGKYAASIPFLSEAVRLRPEHANAHFMLGFAQAALAHSEPAAQARDLLLNQAIAEYARVIELQPDDAEAHEHLAAAYAAAGRGAEAVQTAERALELAQAASRPALVRRIAEHLSQYRGGTSQPASAPATAPASQAAP